MPDNNRRTTSTDGGISIPPIPNNNSGVEPIAKPEIEHMEPIPTPALQNVEPTASFAVDIISSFTLNINKKIDPPLFSPTIVHFRPRGDNWRNENFGFDWVRIGDSGMWSDNTEQRISEDRDIECIDYYLRLMGKYFQNGTNTPANNPNDWRFMEDGTTRCSFRVDINQYKNLIQDSYPIAFSIPWKAIVKESDISFHSSITEDVKPEIVRSNYTYYSPILFIRQGLTANLKIRIQQFAQGVNPIRLEFEEYFKQEEIASATSNFSFSNASIAPFPPDNTEISITCNQVLNDFRYIDAFAIYSNTNTEPGQPPEIKKQCGQLRVYPNNTIRKFKILHIPIVIDRLGFDPSPKNLSVDIINETNRIFNNQCLIDLDIVRYSNVTLNNNIPSLDTPPRRLRIGDYVDSSGRQFTDIDEIVWAAFNNDLNTKAIAAQSRVNIAQQNHDATPTSATQSALDAAKADPELNIRRFNQYVKIFIINANTSKAHSTNTRPDGSSIILFNNGGAETLAHELMHALGLLHPFSSNEAFGFKAQQTENLMDYCHVNADFTALSPGTPRLSVWYWQLKKIWKQLDTMDYIRELRAGRTPAAPQALPTEENNEVTIGKDKKLAPFESIAKI